MMLYDLTKISGQRVSQVDELHVGGRVWMRSTDFFLILGGMGIGVVLASLVRMVWRGSWVPYLLVPVCGFLLFFMFTRKRSRAGEVNRRRWDKWRDRRSVREHAFILPGNPEPFSPNMHRIILLHSHPLHRK